jgi:ParB-like chromosome segregation protein Spo0J
MRSRFLADKIELWSTEKLVPSARNARTHSDKQIAEVAGSIAAYGFIVPVVVDHDGRLIAGHGRVLAARKLGLANIPVIVIHHLSELDQRAYALADNKITQNAGWDDALLKIELAALASEGIDLQTLGFDQEELDDLLTNLENAIMADDEDSAPPVPEKTVTRPGKIWKMAEHRLLCGDATEEQS